jgi:hypothetical protein
MLCKRSGINNPRERGWSVTGMVVRFDRSTLTAPTQTCSGHSLKKTLSDGKFGLGPGHVQRGPDKSGPRPDKSGGPDLL